MNMLNDNTAVYRKLLDLIESGSSCVVVTVIDKSGFGPFSPGSKMLVWSGSRVAGTVGGGAVEFEAIEEANRAHDKAESYQKSYSFNDDEHQEEAKELNMACGGKASLFFEYIPPRENLYLFGAGHIGNAIIGHISKLGFRIVLIDPREGFVQNLTDAQLRITGDFDTLKKHEKPPTNAFFVLASHSHEEDYKNLKKIIAANLKPKYIGCIASKSKARKFAEDLEKHFGKGLDLSRLYSPIGLAIGGKKVEDIALSIVAEIQAIRYGKEDNRHLSIIQKEFSND